MICPECEEEYEYGNFCSECGAELMHDCDFKVMKEKQAKEDWDDLQGDNL